MNARTVVSRLISHQDVPALVTFVTAGYPRVEDTVPIMLAMQAGGADIIELGVPFSDPIADGPAIQETNAVRILRDQRDLRLTTFDRLLFTTGSTTRLAWDMLGMLVERDLPPLCCSWVCADCTCPRRIPHREVRLL